MRTLVIAAALVASASTTRLATADDTPADDDVQSPSRAAGTTVRALASGGASAATLFGIGSTAVHVDAGVAAQQGRWVYPFVLTADIGRTTHGLQTGEITLSGGAQRTFGRLRLGGGLDLGYGWIGRARTSTGPHIGMYALDAFLLATFDVIDLGDARAVYVGVRPSVGPRWGESFFAWGHGTTTWRGAAFAGLRF
jgi:hypothetical protein